MPFPAVGPLAAAQPRSPVVASTSPAPALDAAAVIERLEPLLTDARRDRIQAVLAARSDYVTFVFERMIDPHNLSAALRSLDAFAFQDVHLVNPGERLEVARGIAIGSEPWLSLHSAPDIAASVRGLKRAGYTVYASHLVHDATPLAELDFSRRTALVFGNEHEGVSDAALAAADGAFRINMRGFVQSLNLSVAVAICAHEARRELERLIAIAAQPERFTLSETRRQALYADWLRASVKNAERILAGGEAKPIRATRTVRSATGRNSGAAASSRPRRRKQGRR